MKLIRAPKPGRIVVEDEPTCARAMEALSPVTEAAIDVEWDGQEDRVLSLPQSVQVAFPGTEIFFHEEYLRRLKPWIDAKPTGLFYSAKGDMWWLANAGMPWKGDVYDTMVEDYLCDENVKIHGDYEESLKARHAQVFDHAERPGFKKLFGKQSVQEIIASGKKRLLEDYGCADARDTLEFHANRRERLEHIPWDADESMFDYFKTYDAPLTQVLYDMERVGFAIDVPFLQELQTTAQDELERLERRFYVACGEHVDFEDKKSGFSDKILNSPKQLKKLFYEVLKYPAQYHYDKSGGERKRKLTTDEEALTMLTSMGYEIPSIMTEFRSLGKLKGTYIDGMLQRASARGRIHTDFMQAYTVTGRLSSRDPNLQNLPRSENDRLGIRHAFIPSPGMRLFGGDMSQVETRLMAHMSGDPDMIAACESGDIYAVMAAYLFHKPDTFFAKDAKGELSREAARLRQITKAIVLGVGFGKMAKSIAADIGCSETEAEKFLKMYFGKFPRFAAFMQKLIRECRDHGFVRTITGRYRHIPEIRSSDFWKRAHAERGALNSPIQGSARDIIVKSMLNIRSSGVLQEYDSRMLLQVHDELVFEGPPTALPEIMPKIKEMMEHPFATELKVKTPAKMFEGLSYGECK